MKPKQTSWPRSLAKWAPSNMTHKSVLLHEAIDGLNIKSGDIFVDGTLGNGGHSLEVAKRFGSKVKIVGIDMDQKAIERSKKLLDKSGADTLLTEGNFRNIDQILQDLNITKVNAILLDIGLSSNQLEESGRGFTFQEDEKLLMTFKDNPTEEDVTAWDVVNNWEEENLEAIIRGYGEERYAGRIARAIVEARQVSPIESTGELAAIIEEAVPGSYKRGKINPSTRTFQAIRIAVNDELQALKEGIEKSFNSLSSGGRLAVISFHSLEDRIVKNYFKNFSQEEKGKIITKKPIEASEEEIKENRRSRSAKLRIIEKI